MIILDHIPPGYSAHWPVTLDFIIFPSEDRSAAGPLTNYQPWSPAYQMKNWMWNEKRGSDHAKPIDQGQKTSSKQRWLKLERSIPVSIASLVMGSRENRTISKSIIHQTTSLYLALPFIYNSALAEISRLQQMHWHFKIHKNKKKRRNYKVLAALILTKIKQNPDVLAVLPEFEAPQSQLPTNQSQPRD